jgi:hypothetical protein
MKSLPIAFSARWAGCLLSITSLLGAGCQGAFGPRQLPDDPLFFRRDPVEAKARYTPPVPLKYVEPSPPRNPYLDIAGRGSADNVTAAHLHPDRPVPGILTNRSTPPERDFDIDDNP